MKYKSRTNSFSKSNTYIKNTITTLNFKIKDIHILLDDITTDKASRNNLKIKRYSSLRNNNDYYQNFTTMTNKDSNNYIYNKKKFNSKKSKDEKEKSVKSIPISFKRFDSYKTTDTTIPSFLTTMEGFYTPNLTGLISERNNLNKKLSHNKINYNDIRCKIDYIIDDNKNKIYKKKNNNDKSRCSYRRSFNTYNITPIIFRTKILKGNFAKRKNILKSKTINIKNCQTNVIVKPTIEKKKIKIVFNHKNKINSSSFFNLKYIILIQKWWKRIKKKEIIYKIPKENNLNQIYSISKYYYRNNNLSIILIQNYFKKFLSRSNFYNINPLKANNIHNNTIIQKPEIKACYITKLINNETSPVISKNITFGNKKINNIYEKRRNLKYKLIYNYNALSYNVAKSNYNLKYDQNTIQSFNNSELRDYNNNDIINKLSNEIMNKNMIKSNKSFTILRQMFIRIIFLKLNSILFQVGYNYKSLLNFMNSIYWIFIKFQIGNFFKNLSYFSTKKFNFIKNIFRHINIYQRNKFIKNEIIELIEKNFSGKINNDKIDIKLLKFTSEQENNLINTQVFKDDKNLIHYIYLFFKLEKNKKVNKNFIENRLIKEPLNYRNIFTILRYIDNLDQKINTNKICTNCFCKKNEKVCSLNCNCHFPMNIILKNSCDLNNKKILREFNTYQICEENIENNQNILNIKPKNHLELFISSENNYIRGMRINKTFHYFNK